MSARIGFYGGVGSVTGANFLVETEKTKLLIDCGLMQGGRFADAENCEAFPYTPSDVSALLVTHAHADHIGRIPKLVGDGFHGRIISTHATRDLARVMLEDAYKVMRFEHERYQIPMCYEEQHIEAAFRLWEGVDYNEQVLLEDGITARFTDAGHILGSAMVHLTRGGRTLVCTGDVGNVPQPLMNPPVVPKDYDYLIMESVYGDRTHEEVEERSDLLLHYIKDTQRKKGTLIIPAFSLERTQGMLFEINNFVERGDITPLPVFLDSPLAIRVTDIYRRYKQYLKKEVQAQIREGDDIFSFDGLSFTKTVADSSEIEQAKGAKIIIAGSGMSHGGRIVGHEKRHLEDPNTTLLLVGYQAVGSTGRLLQDGAKQIKLDGERVRVRANIARIQGYSGHADRDQLVDLVAEGGEKAKRIFVAMGEEHSSLFLVQRLRDYLGVNAMAPDAGEVVEIDF